MKRKSHGSQDFQDQKSNPFDRSDRNKTVQSRLLFFCSFVVFLVLTHKPVLEAYANWLSPEDSDPSADIAVVLDTYKDRLEAAVKLFEEKKVKAIYVNAIPRSVFKKYIEKYNLPPDKVYWGGCKIFTTYDQPIAFLDGVERYKIADRNIVLVSHGHHLRRSLWTYHHILDKSQKKFNIKTHIVSDKKIVKEWWWLDKYTREFVSSETQKLIFYWVNYGLFGKTERKDLSDIEFQDVFRMDETRYDSNRVDRTCRDDPY